MSSRSTEVNMTNCHLHRQHFFKRRKGGIIHHDVLISFWMMAGYLGPVDSVDEAYRRGHLLLGDLIQQGLLKHSNTDREMIELVASPGSTQVCRHDGSCVAASPEFVEMLDLGRIERIVLTDGMMKKQRGSPDDNYLSRQVFQSQRGLKYLGHFNSTPNSPRPLLENVENPSVLMLRGCDDQFFPMSYFTFHKFKTLTVLEMSGSGLFTTVPIHQTIPKLNQLRYLCLSDPLIDSLPMDLFSEIRELRWLILRGCSCLVFDPYTENLKNLEVLDLSQTSTTTTPFLLGEKLTHLFLRDSKLLEFPSSYFHPSLQVLDLSGNPELDFIHSSSLIEIELEINVDGDNLGMVKPMGPIHISENVPTNEVLTNLEVLDLSGCENLFELPEDLGDLRNLKELNLSGCSHLENLTEDLFHQMSCLVKLDLSATKIKHLPSFANLTSLRKLSLWGLELVSLENFETWTSLSNLVELDLHGLMVSYPQELRLDFLQPLRSLQILNLSKTAVVKLPDMSKFGSLRELLLADCQHLKVLPDLQPLTSLETLDLSLAANTFVNNCHLEIEPGLVPSSLRKLVLTNRFGVQNLFPPTSLGNLEFLDVRGTDEIDFIGAPIQEQGTISTPVHIHFVQATNNQLSGFDRFVYEFARLDALISDIQQNPDGASNANTQSFKCDCRLLHDDLKYIQQNINRLQGSRHCKRIEELLLELMDAATDLSAADFTSDSPNLMQLFRVVVQVKLLFPPKQATNLEALNINKKVEQSLFTRRVKKENSDADVEYHPEETEGLCRSYESLTDTQKNCLLCFAAFPLDEDEGLSKKSLVIKKRILIYWWVGEGFIDPQNEENVGETIEDTGKRILYVLMGKGFIEPVIRKRWETGSCRMHHSVYSFVTAQAKAEGFYDFSKEKNKLTPYFTRSSRNCLVESQDRLRSSTKQKAKNTNSRESLRNVLTLFNVNESLVDIKSEWFSKMKHLSVLYLGSWRCSENTNQIEVVEQKFLEDLKRMKQLRLFSLQGLLTVRKLPDSVCKLTSLVILDLRECGYLDELPSDIGYLENLTHLDLTNCVLLTQLPKGISLLSKLEVLKGFVITSQAAADPDPHDQKGRVLRNQWWERTKRCVKQDLLRFNNDEMCKVRDLSRLDNLRKLSIVVNTSTFPHGEDIMALNEMKSLRELKILWQKSFHVEPFRRRMLEHCDSRYLRTCLHGIEKLELWCFPHKLQPNWLFPHKLQSLEKLYIIGGNLETLDVKRRGWNVKTLRLKYLPNLRVSWYDLTHMFEHMSYMEIHQCKQLKFSMQATQILQVRRGGCVETTWRSINAKQLGSLIDILSKSESVFC